MIGRLPPGMVILTSSEALRAAALAAIPATPATPATLAIPASGSDYGNDSEIFVTQSPLEALWALARRSATAAAIRVAPAAAGVAFLADIRSLAFREREIFAAARASCPAARLVAMGESEDELQLRGVSSAVDELAVGASEVRRAVRRALKAELHRGGNGAAGMGAGAESAARRQDGAVISAENGSMAAGMAVASGMASGMAACLKRMAERRGAEETESPQQLAGRLSEAFLAVEGVEAAALVMLPASTGNQRTAKGGGRATPAAGAAGAQLLALSGAGLGVEEALGAEHVNGDRAWSSVGRGRWLMPIETDDRKTFGVLVRLAGDGGIDEAAVLDELETAALVAAKLYEAGCRSAAAVRMMTLDAESGLHRRGYIEPYINALLREARRRRREVLVAVARTASQGQSGRGAAYAAEVRQIGRWLSGIMKDSHVGRWDDTTVVAAIPARDTNQLHLAQRLIEDRENGSTRAPLAASAKFPWDGETAEALVTAASKKFEARQMTLPLSSQ